MSDAQIFVDGIGPPLGQIEQDYRKMLAFAESEVEGCGSPDREDAEVDVCIFRDVLALITEVKRLRAAAA